MSTSPSPLLLLELNEINFESIEAYARAGKLPALSSLLARHGYSRTESEQDYETLEPWIQWVTAHTGLSFAEHGVFRLGDIVHHDLVQIWEQLEAYGLKVGAVSPLNAKNRTRNAAFFVPDPWTETDVTGSQITCRLYEAIAQAVNDNAGGRLEISSKLWLALGAAANARPSNYGRYVKLALSGREKPWAKAMFLDLLLADFFVGKIKQSRPDFATLFLNAGAHIQHHYMFSSSVYSGRQKNPAWYVPDAVDPVLEVYELYDRIIADVMHALPNYRLMLSTGLHQDPHPQLTYYWRLKEHAAFLQELDISFQRVEPRMSRDFLVVCASSEQAREAERQLAMVTSADGTPLFSIDNRGGDLFVMLTYPKDIPPGFSFLLGNQRFEDLRRHVAFVAIKNGQHNGIGYFLDAGSPRKSHPDTFPLRRLPDILKTMLGVGDCSAQHQEAV